MFWKFLALVILGLFFIKFGMMAAVVPLLSGGLQFALIVILVMICVVAYRSMKKVNKLTMDNTSDGMTKNYTECE